jgi:parallel beta-helix repeat protein
MPSTLGAEDVAVRPGRRPTRRSSGSPPASAGPRSRARRILLLVAAVAPLLALAVLVWPAEGPRPGADAGMVALYRVNAGGGQLPGDPPWEADGEAQRSSYLRSDTNKVADTAAGIRLDASVPDDVPQELFSTERYHYPAGSAPMVYEFPVDRGQYRVRLYFAEIFDKAQSAGARRFDVHIEGDAALDDYDTFADVGGYTGVMKAFETTVDDGALTVALAATDSPQPPRIMGLEILAERSAVALPQTPPSPPPAEAPAEAPADAVPVAVGENLQAVVDANPAGTTYIIAAGVHRNQQVIPKDGDTFTGERGAVLSGASVLDAWEQRGGRWTVGGQTAEGPTSGEVEDGRERDLHPEDLSVDGKLLRHVDDPEVEPGEWHFDYDADRIWLGDDPAGKTVELAVTPWAFAGSGVSDVTISNLEIRQYASQAQGGAIGSGKAQGYEHNTRDWTVEHVFVHHNHGGGIRIGPGMTIRNSEIAYNGQIGINGQGIVTGESVADPKPGFVTIVDNHIHHNLTLGYAQDWEGGGLKLLDTWAGSLFANNLVEHNAGTGIWYDVDNRNARIASNLTRNNARQGIFYELSFGPDTAIVDNTVLDNGDVGIHVVDSHGVEVTGNLVEGNVEGIVVQAGRRAGDAGDLGQTWDTRDVHVHRNHTQPDGNGYRRISGNASGEAVIFEANSEVSGVLPDGATAFRPSHYGPR